MSEYSRRILAFSAIAIILGISVSVGIAFLPSATKSQSSVTQVSTETLASTVVQSSTATVTTTLTSTTTAVSSSASTITEGGTTILTTISSVTTVLSSSSTVVSTTSSSATSSSVSQTANSSTTVTSSTTASCFIQGYPDGIYLQILTNSGAVISGLMVSGQSAYIANGQECTNSLRTITNSTGWAYLGSNPGIYYVSFSYSGNSYNLTIPSQPVTESIATYYVPSGNLTIEYCTYGNPQMCSS